VGYEYRRATGEFKMAVISLLEILKSTLEEIRGFRTESMRKAFKIPENTNFITAYHGTSEKNAKNIIRTKLRSGAWLSTDRSEAEKGMEVNPMSCKYDCI
jgi:hypothetical protein